jgi:D-beta-D-heptose 7-phosphate kinase/D-beta-D-heptose 1-phosphate adenosyltransferase|tara:strand:+ start:357 stop:752 length:396 start_codon:yes stop_codon:yes gene_type:complete
MKKIWINGCFDILHVGHLRLLEYAKSRGDFLTVGIDSDDRIKELKGKDRPINNEFLRTEMLEALKWVDNVVVFSSDKELEQLIQLTSDLMIIGSDYKNKRIVGSQYSKVEFFDRVDGHSTTNLVKRIKRKE